MANLNLMISIYSKFLIAFVAQSRCSCPFEVLCSWLTGPAVSCTRQWPRPSCIPRPLVKQRPWLVWCVHLLLDPTPAQLSTITTLSPSSVLVSFFWLSPPPVLCRAPAGTKLPYTRGNEVLISAAQQMSLNYSSWTPCGWMRGHVIHLNNKQNLGESKWISNCLGRILRNPLSSARAIRPRPGWYCSIILGSQVLRTSLPTSDSHVVCTKK